MPVFGFAEERFDPDLAFAHGFCVGGGGVIAPHPLQILGVEGAVHLTPLIAAGAGSFDRAAIAGRGSRAVDDDLFLVLRGSSPEWVALRALVLIPFRVVGEERGS